MSAAKRQSRRAPIHGTPAMHADVDALAAAARARGQEPNAVQIYQELVKKYPSLPIARTIRDWLKETTRASMWRATRSSVAERVLPTLARVAEHTHGAVVQLTTRQADVIAAVVEAGPLKDPLQAYYFALDYIAAEDRGEDDYITMLDLQLAFAPWRSPEAQRRYDAAIANEYVAVPMGPFIERDDPTVHRDGRVIRRGRPRGETMTGARYADYVQAMQGRSASIIAMRGAPAQERPAAARSSSSAPRRAEGRAAARRPRSARAAGRALRDKRDKRGNSAASR